MALQITPMWHCRLHLCGTENKKSCSFSTSDTVHVFLCFAPQMAQLGFFLELSFSHKLYDFPTTLCSKRESNLCRQICTSLRDLDSRRMQMLSTTAVVVADKRAFPVESLTKCSHLLLVFFTNPFWFSPLAAKQSCWDFFLVKKSQLVGKECEIRTHPRPSCIFEMNLSTETRQYFFIKLYFFK